MKTTHLEFPNNVEFSCKKFETINNFDCLDSDMNVNKELFMKYQQEANLGKSIHLKMFDKQMLSKFSGYIKKPFGEVTKEDLIRFFNDLDNGTHINVCCKT
jgi:hypothetical protein